MRNVAKINLELEHCTECPYCRKPQGYSELYCQHDLYTPGIEVGDGDVIPDFCPFVIERLENVLKTIEDGSVGTIPKKYLNQIERKQKDDPDPKFGVDHAWSHIRDVTAFGKAFLGDCVEYGYSTPNTVQKEGILLAIAAYLHDIGLADSSRNHEIHSAELAKKYLSGPKIDIDVEDAYTIVHAIYNHSKGEETRTIVDAALVLADKLDVVKSRVVRPTDEFVKEMTKINKASFRIYGRDHKAEGAVLRYEADEGFDVAKMKLHPKHIQIPKMIATEYLGLPTFKFMVNDEVVDIKGIIG